MSLESTHFDCLDAFMRQFFAKDVCVRCMNSAERYVVVQYLANNWGFFVNKDEQDTDYGKILRNEPVDNNGYDVECYNEKEFEFIRQSCKKAVNFVDFVYLIESENEEPDEWSPLPIADLYKGVMSE